MTVEAGWFEYVDRGTQPRADVRAYDLLRLFSRNQNSKESLQEP